MMLIIVILYMYSQLLKRAKVLVWVQMSHILYNSAIVSIRVIEGLIHPTPIRRLEYNS